MKKIFLLCLTIFLNAESPYLGDESFPQEKTQQAPVFIDLYQKSFFKKGRKGRENTLEINYKDGHTYNIRTRFGMVSSIIFEDDLIIQSVLGDTAGFEIQIFEKNKSNARSLVLIKPKVAGIDTNLFLMGESGRVYNFYLFSTNYENSFNPALQIFVKTEFRQKQIAKNNESNAKKNDKSFLIISNGINTIKIPRKKLREIKYTQKGEERLKAIKIFQDNKRTYFQYKADDGKYTFPVVYAVVNGYDSRVSTQIIGDYIVADKISKSWTLRNGESYVCVRFLDD